MDAEEKAIIAPSTKTLLTHGELNLGDTSTSTLVNASQSSLTKSPCIMTTKLDNDSEQSLKQESNNDMKRTSASTADTYSPDVEKQEPERQPRSKWYSIIRYTALNTYRRLFSLVFLGNVVAFLVIMVRERRLLDLVNAASINLCICGLARQPLVVNSLFVMACKVPRSAPIRLRNLAAKVFHFGGVHSGCGVASAVWYVAFVGQLTYECAHGKIPSSAANIAVVVLAYLIMLLLCAIIISAYPAIRFKYHDYFELIHRFSGWTIIAMFWPLLMTFASQQKPSMGHFLLHQPSFWIIILLTIAIIQPWIMLRKVKVTAEVLSTHATRLHFDFTTTKFGQGISISRHPLRDWHSFASFPDKFDRPDTKFSLVVSKAGDFTGDIIANPPTHIWKRSVPAYGFGYVMRLYSRMILVTTGSGIGPCLSFLGDDDRPKMRVLWQTRSPERTYGKDLIKLVHEMDPDPIIMDTTMAGGRADMLPQIMKLYKEFNAEAVCIISNPKTTKHLVYELERRGILAMGPIFDS